MKLCSVQMLFPSRFNNLGLFCTSFFVEMVSFVQDWVLLNILTQKQHLHHIRRVLLIQFETLGRDLRLCGIWTLGNSMNYILSVHLSPCCCGGFLINTNGLLLHCVNMLFPFLLFFIQILIISSCIHIFWIVIQNLLPWCLLAFKVLFLLSHCFVCSFNGCGWSWRFAILDICPNGGNGSL